VPSRVSSANEHVGHGSVNGSTMRVMNQQATIFLIIESDVMVTTETPH
jgi:hypothetical protein